MIKIVVDLMGADKPSNQLVSGAIKAINENDDLMVTLCAKEEDIIPVLNTLSYNKEQVEIIDCKEEITNYDIPTKAFRKKPDSSLIKGLNLCNTDPLAKGFVSCGSFSIEGVWGLKLGMNLNFKYGLELLIKIISCKMSTNQGFLKEKYLNNWEIFNDFIQEVILCSKLDSLFSYFNNFLHKFWNEVIVDDVGE